MSSKNDELPVFYPVKSLNDLISIKGFQIDNVSMAEEKRINIILKKEASDKDTVYRELMITADGSRFLSNEYL